MARVRDTFSGEILGVGSSLGVRLVVGSWTTSPLGAFTDVMVETASGHRVLVAPNDQVAAYVTATYRFDEIRVEPLEASADRSRWVVRSPSVTLDAILGSRMPLGWLLRLVPRPVAIHPRWAQLVNPIAQVVVPGVRTVGIAQEGRREFYGATDIRAVAEISGEFDGQDLGTLAPIDPPCRFGFSSTPHAPSLTSVVTTVEH